MQHRGVSLAGGSATHLHLVTQAIAKQPLPIYDANSTNEQFLLRVARERIL